MTGHDGGDDTSVSGASERLVIDFDAWPGASLGTMRFDVPRGPLSRVKRELREFLQASGGVTAAYLLLVSRAEWGDHPQLIVGVATDRDIEPLFRAWQERPIRTRVGFFPLGDDALSAFARAYLLPFFPVSTTSLPESMTDGELIETIQSLPDVPHLAATAMHLKTLEERYDDLPPDMARAEQQAQERERENTLRELRERSTHGAAREALLRCLNREEPFSLLLRTFDREVVSGSSGLTGGASRLWITDRSLEAHAAKVTPLPLIGIANPLDPFPPSNYRLLEVGDNWLHVVVSLVARAAAVFLICDRLSAGITTELMVIDRLQREDDTLIIVPAEDAAAREKPMHFLEHATPVAPLQPQVMIRRLAGFGMTVTSTEFLRQPAHDRQA
jgi:hypothetical protein